MGYKFNKSDIEKLRAKNDIKGLIKTLKNEDSNIRMFTAISLGEIGNEKAIAPLIQSLKDGRRGPE